MNDTYTDFFELSVNELLALNLILALLLSNRLNGNQLNILGNFLCSLGQSILTVQAVIGALPAGAVYTICANPAYKTPAATPPANAAPMPEENTSSQIQSLQERLAAIESILTAQKR